MLSSYKIHNELPINVKQKKVLILTINAYSYVVALKDNEFQKSLKNCDILLPDGVSIVLATKFLTGKKIKKISGADVFESEMRILNHRFGKCFFLGSTYETLEKIKNKTKLKYPNINLGTFSPPFKNKFSDSEEHEIIKKINTFEPDVLFVGMTAPKQEKWAFNNYSKLNAKKIICIGAVFDFYAENINRAPDWIIKIGLEWFYRFLKEPRRLWKRVIIGNSVFIHEIIKQKLTK